MNTLLLVYMKSLSLMSDCERDSISWDEMKVTILLTPILYLVRTSIAYALRSPPSLLNTCRISKKVSKASNSTPTEKCTGLSFPCFVSVVVSYGLHLII